MRNPLNRRAAVLLATGAALAAALSAGVQDAYLLRYDLKPNTSEKFKIEIQSKQKIGFPGAPPEIEIKGQMDFEMATRDLDEKGLADVELKATNVKMEGPEMPMTGEMPKEIIFKGKLDSRNRMTGLQAAGLPAEAELTMRMSGASSSITFVELPEGPVKIGDTWEIEMPKNPMFGDQVPKLTAKLLALKEFDSEPAYEIGLTGKVTYDINLGEALKAAGGENPMGDLEIRMKGTTGFEGLAYLARAGGKTLELSMTMDAKQTMSVMGMEGPVDGVTTTKMKRAK
jgi:hypothetical protein